MGQPWGVLGGISAFIEAGNKIPVGITGAMKELRHNHIFNIKK